ncbi:MAG TPA: hypothetical protein VFC65_01340 [Prolixibacteraceae bacterium]|nr:hypothetical protein [Prolixibacteraceae bacterium]
MANFRKKILKITAAILSGLILIVLAGFVFMYFETQNYLNRNLSDFIEKKSKGKYELTFDNLEINFSHWGFDINQVSFHPSDSVMRTLDQNDITKQFYTFSSPNIRFGGIKLAQLIIRKRLEIEEILISQPELNIHGKQISPGDQKNNTTAILQELMPLVTKTFKSIQIDKIELANASFDFYNLLGNSKKLSNAENITIGILNFYTDSVLLPDLTKMFDAEDIYIRMQNYQNKLADSIHAISAESVTYSMKRSYIEAHNIELKPLHQELSVKNRYHIIVPLAKITSTHINEFYRNNAIPIDSMILTGAKIEYWPGEMSKKLNLHTIKDLDLYDLIKNEFTSVRIENFKLRNAQVKLFRTQTDITSQQELKNITINLEDFLLDSTSLEDTSRIFYAKNIDFSASQYELTLGDNIHRIRVGNLDLSTREKSILVKNIKLYPLETGNNTVNQKNTIDANCDSIRLDMFNFKKAFHEKRFVFQRINIFNPEVRIIQNELSNKKPESENPSFVYNLISSYVKGIYSDQVFVKKGKLQLVNRTGVLQKGNIESTIRLNLTGFALDEISARRTDRLFFANQIELNFNNYKMQLVDQLHKMTIENLSISTRTNQLNLQNLHLFPASKENGKDLLNQFNRSELYEFTIPELTMLNADFHEAFFNKKLTVDTLQIESPQIFYENFALLKQSKPKADFEDLFELLSSYLDNIHVMKVMIPDGTIRLINHSRKGKTISLNNHFTLGLENTLINKEQFGQKKLLYSEFVDFSVRDHLIHLSDNVHVVKAGEVGFSTRNKEVFVINAQIYPEPNSKDFSSIIWNIQLTIPEIRITGINMEEFYFDHKINAENILIKSPSIRLYQKQKRTGGKEIKEVSFPLPKEIESIGIRQFKLNDGSLKVFSEMGTKPYLLVQSDLKMEAQNILIKKDPKADKPQFKSGEYTGEMLQFKFTPKNKNQQFSIDELTFSTEDRRILVKQLLVKPKTKSTKEDQFVLRIPTLAMNGFDIDNAYRNDQFFFESIVIEEPVFQLFNNAIDSLKFNPFKVNLYPHFESFADVFASKTLRVNNADISVFKSGKKKLLEKVSMNLLNVRIDNKPPQGFMHAVDFSFKIPNLKKQEKLYQFTIGETSYSSKNNRFSANNIRISPNYSKEKHQKQVGFQSDYFNGKIDSICIQEPDIRRWFEKEELAGKYLSVNRLNMDIFRDKRFPFDDSRRPEMLQDIIKSFQYPFMLDSFMLVNSDVSYAEQPIAGDSAGRINFTNIRARIKPFSNMKSSTGKIPDFNIDATATVMDSCQLKTSMNYQMNSPENKFTASGSLSSFDMQILNPVLEPLALVSMRSGQVDRFDFSFTADKASATGQLFFGYNDLKISVLEIKDGNIKEAGFASFLANNLLLSSKNPRGKELLPEEISFQRDEKRSVLNYWWKSVFSGIRNTLGFKDNKSEGQE